MRRSQQIVAGEVYRDGLTQRAGRAGVRRSRSRRARRCASWKSAPCWKTCSPAPCFSANAGGVQVLIGGEGTWEELRECSMVLARYGVPGLATGTLGVLGPMRMPYGRIISTVRFVAGLLSDLVVDMHAEVMSMIKRSEASEDGRRNTSRTRKSKRRRCTGSLDTAELADLDAPTLADFEALQAEAGRGAGESQTNTWTAGSAPGPSLPITRSASSASRRRSTRTRPAASSSATWTCWMTWSGP